MAGLSSMQLDQTTSMPGDPHLIALELGGAPQDVANLWPQPWSGEANAHMQDAVETHLNRELGAVPGTSPRRSTRSPPTR
jgi:hypothetical protein